MPFKAGALSTYRWSTPCRDIVSRRERLFLKITKSHLSISDYLEFILYEKDMHQTITDKEKKMHVKLTGLKASLSTRIMRLYREVLAKFPHDRRLWSNWIKFSKKVNPVEVAGIYEKMLLVRKLIISKVYRKYNYFIDAFQYHGDEPDFWVDAACWLYEYNRLNFDRVKDILLRGLQRHPDSEVLNKCFFDIMLKEASLASNERNLAENTLSEQDIKLERVEAVYRNSMTNITHLDYFVKLLESCEDHAELTLKLQRVIIDDMQEKFPGSRAYGICWPSGSCVAITWAIWRTTKRSRPTTAMVTVVMVISRPARNRDPMPVPAL